ncbi:M1 family metallopeptidase [Nocardioides baculatus]|uniref:Aminopeptidase N n=1 Tax=Nocardioides baculatus TaxID=2801337 RepID=A0ABS1L592_9ACTN|nr:M1 family metallopeptidase [Nocardioides baculatus]MBL0746861.1 M1 family metallopeptidase [Nocardioides baculatus]
MTRRRRLPVVLPVLGALLLAGCSSESDSGSELATPSVSPTSASTTDTGQDATVPTSAPVIVPAVEQALDTAESTPVEDSVYPAVGDPRIDALLYDLDLDWDPGARRLEASAVVAFRAARTAPRFQLDLGPGLTVGRLELDGEAVGFARRGKDLVVRAPIEADQRYELSLDYVGTPKPAKAPTTRRDFSTTGFTVTDTGEVWTMQEPFGAYTWYPVNDQPSDKALYDVTIHAPMPWTGISNGHLTEMTDDGETTTSSWQLTEPASSYLVTLAIGDYTHSANTTESGLRVDYWTPRGLVKGIDGLQTAAASIDWIEGKLGPYPFDSLGLVVTDSQSAMETQTMVTLGNNDYVLSPQVVAHELVHQWYGDQVSPADWRDVWLNEGMTMLMQWLYEDEQDMTPLRQTISQARAGDQGLRDDYGPPGAYDPQQFGGSNIYYAPALMWNELRVELGDDEFFRIARSWLEDNDNTSATREQIFEHWETETGRELSAFFDSWITGRTTPEPGVPKT